MPANHLYTHYLFIPLQISHGPYFSLSFPKSSFIDANHLLLRQHILEILCNVLSHITTLIQRFEHPLFSLSFHILEDFNEFT
ncbi:hypothetical protein PRUPE_6G265800 [Prunus persica]|uniref:Uncharacterized protein n=1 Tax=Prunus persica TaxID=3760 RepID=A0A251NW88_PRUPE|nr:hypothetical protein PRUPE_6G265800 [Prunus persica]